MKPIAIHALPIRPALHRALPARAVPHQHVVDASVAVGGLLRAEAFSHLLRDKHGQPVSTLARWIVDRRVLSVVWCGEIMVPLFQFARPALEPAAAMRSLWDEFDGVFDAWELLEWFLTANATLDDQAPARRLLSDPDSVLQAARLDRFIVAGL